MNPHPTSLPELQEGENPGGKKTAGEVGAAILTPVFFPRQQVRKTSRSHGAGEERLALAAE